MKVCFHHERFDIDVSSGTAHSLYQWHALFHAFGVKEVAVINHTDEAIPYMGSDIESSSYSSLAEFIDQHRDEKLTYVEQGGTSYRDFDFSETDWLIFGGTGGLPRSDVGIDTGRLALYPREAAAIILAETKWQ